MQAQASHPTVSAEAFGSLARLQQLTLEAGLSAGPKQLAFRILNRSIICCRYDRAVLWNLAGMGIKLLGVSGNTGVNPRSPLIAEWRSLVGAMSDRDTPAVIGSGSFHGKSDAWETLTKRTGGLSVIWMPVKVDGRTVAGLWLERWGDDRFTAGELAQLETLALAYGVAWRAVVRVPGRLTQALRSRKWTAGMLAAVLLVAAACLIRPSLRIVAPCEVVPSEPLAITAPLNGVVDEIRVLPGRTVQAGDLLAVYDKRVATEELKVAAEQVQIIESELQRSRVQAFDDSTARSAISLLQKRLEQEKVRLRLARYHVDKLEVLAPAGGTVMLDDPQEWRGRPVQVGQRLMMIVDPTRTKLRIRLPESDNIDFDPEKPVRVILDSDPRTSRFATLRFVASHSHMGRDGRPCFQAEADWVEGEKRLKTGLQGTAILCGERVPLWYWLLRRPCSAVRRQFGI